MYDVLYFDDLIIFHKCMNVIRMKRLAVIQLHNIQPGVRVSLNSIKVNQRALLSFNREHYNVQVEKCNLCLTHAIRLQKQELANFHNMFVC
jgi:hypothetical protein